MMSFKKSWAIPFVFSLLALLVLVSLLTLFVSQNEHKQAKVEILPVSPFAPYVTPLEDFDKEAYFVCKTLENSWPFTRRGTKFFVATDRAETLKLSLLAGLSAAWTVHNPDGSIRNEIYFWPQTLKEKSLRGITAHELGHIEAQSNNDLAADAFAKKMLMLKRKEMQDFIDFLRKQGMDEFHPRILALLN